MVNNPYPSHPYLFKTGNNAWKITIIFLSAPKPPLKTVSQKIIWICHWMHVD